MSAISNLARRRVLGALTATGVAAITFTSMAAVPGAALAATASLPEYQIERITFVGNAKIYLWYNTSTYYAHGEIFDAVPGDRVQLQWENNTPVIHGGAIIGVASDENYANTGDVKFLGQFRVCGWEGNDEKCTLWWG
jgi:hypothetical protein